MFIMGSLSLCDISLLRLEPIPESCGGVEALALSLNGLPVRVVAFGDVVLKLGDVVPFLD